MPNGSAESPEPTELIDRLYAALFGERPWQDFLSRCCDLLPDGRTVLFYQDSASGGGEFTLSANIDTSLVQQYAAYYHALNPWLDHAMRRPLGRVVQADAMLPREALKRTEFYADYLRHTGTETGLGVTLHRDDPLTMFFSIVCADVSEDRLEHARRSIAALAPHLDRALRLRGAAPRMPGGTLEIDAAMRILHAEPEALALLPLTEALRIGPHGRLCCTDPEVLTLLQQVLAAKKTPVTAQRHLRRRSGRLPLRMSLYRPGPAGEAELEGGRCFLRLDDPAAGLPTGVREFSILHGLTEAEAGIVAGLSAGLAPEQIAAARGTSPATVRTQLKSIFLKSGCSRQSEIAGQVALMVQGPPVCPPPMPASRGG